VVVAVPRAWIDVSAMSDLDDIAASFRARITAACASPQICKPDARLLASHGIADYRVVESLGATEGAPAAGTAEAIVDITTTGTTLAANDLKVLDDGLILESQAVLAASLAAAWPDTVRAAARLILERIAARALAKRAQIIRVRLDPGVEAALPALEHTLGAKLLSKSASGEATVVVPDANLSTAVTFLRASGAQGTVTSERADYIFAADNPLFAKLQAKLS
jgi:ATP phosphoribosyltransferase